jgi:hypothetical protein
MQDTNFAPCKHLHSTGNPCGSPSLRGEEFCYFHHPTRRPRRTRGRKPRLPTFNLPTLDDRNSIQRSVAKVVSRVLSGRLDPQRAQVLLHLLRLVNLAGPGDTRPLDTLIEQAQIRLGFDPFTGLLEVLRDLRPRTKNVPGPA